MLSDRSTGATTTARKGLFYGWVIVVACTSLLVINAGIIYSFGVFFKPMAAHFGWSRAATAGAYSMYQVSYGLSVLAMGWLGDRFGPAKVMTFCGIMAGAGLVLAGQIKSLWQLYLTYGVMVGIGLSGSFAIGTATTARWFTKKRGLALGIVSAGMGLGTLVVVPIAGRLVASVDWSKAFVFFGIATWAIMIPSALLLRRSPRELGQRPYGETDEPERPSAGAADAAVPEKSMGLRSALRRRPLWMMAAAWFLIGFSVQLVMVHLVNYITDVGISSVTAATAVSVIGVGSITGRLAMGMASDRIGSSNALTICFAIVMMTLVWLIFASQIWAFFVFAIVFGFSYGGEVPQLPVLAGQFFGLRAVATLVGAVMVGNTMGGALGAWLGGRIFDMTGSYHTAFAIAVGVALAAVVTALAIRREGCRSACV